MQNIWLYYIEQDVPGAQNMQRDQALAQACAADGQPRLRLYSWSPHALSLGHNQPDTHIDFHALQRAGLDVVRRPTGGRAVLHADEITYAVAMPCGGAGPTVHQAYRQVNMALARGLELLGAQGLAFARTQPDFRAHYDLDDSMNCFSAAALNELTWRGRKLAGSAQRRYGDVLLQHGSLLLGTGHLGITDLLAGLAPERRQAMRRALAARTVTLTEILHGTLPTFGAVAEALAQGFAAVFHAGMRAAGADQPAAPV